jgi:D-alanyl-D-alanine carboxypeptidase
MTRLFLLSLSLLVLAAIATLAQTQAPAQFPATPAGAQFSGWLAAFNTHDRATLLAFLQKNYPDRVAHVDDTMAFGNQTGGFDVVKVEKCEELACTVLLQEKNSDQFAEATAEVDPAPPHQLKKIAMNAIPRPPGYAVPRLSQSDAIAALKARIEKASAAGSFSGAALVAKDGKPIFTGAYGMANREKQIPNTLDTKFRIGSMNKMFTATAIVQLAQAGKLKLDEPLIAVLPDYPNKAWASKVTIHQLLTHTGGAGDIFGPDFDQHRLELRILNDYVKLYGKRDPTFEPGTQWDYANYGFLLLGVVVEKVSGEDYYAYVREHIFKPAGMNSTDSLPEDQPVANRSIGYMADESGTRMVPNDPTLPYRGTSAGGGYSTVGDLLAFANALESNKLLDAEHTALLTTGKVETQRGPKYAYGFFDEVSDDGVRCFGHGGGAPGMNGELQICATSGYTVAVLANQDPQAATNEARFVLARLPAQ